MLYVTERLSLSAAALWGSQTGQWLMKQTFQTQKDEKCCREEKATKRYPWKPTDED